MILKCAILIHVQSSDWPPLSHLTTSNVTFGFRRSSESEEREYIRDMYESSLHGNNDENDVNMVGENDNRGSGGDDEVAGDDMDDISTAPSADDDDMEDI